MILIKDGRVCAYNVITIFFGLVLYIQISLNILIECQVWLVNPENIP